MHKAVSYIRVSKQREDMLTVDTQLNKMQKYCELHDIKVIRDYQDIDFSGRNADRPDFQKMMNDIENNIIEPDYVLVYKLDRFSRSVTEFYKFMSRLEENNVDLISITQHFDTSTPIGRTMMGILIQFAQFESDMTGQRIKDNLQNNAENGRWNGGNVPYGYNWDEDQKLLKPDPYESKIVNMIFEDYINGKGSYTIAEKLQKKGIKSPSGKDQWSESSIAYIVKNPLYAGKIQYNNKVYGGKHDGIIDQGTFEKANNILKQYANSKNTGNKYLASGLTKCAQCGSFGFIKITGPQEYKKRRYVCANRNKNSKKVCDTPYLDAPSFEEKLKEKIFEIVDTPKYFEKLKEGLRTEDDNDDLSARKSEIHQEIKKLDNVLSKLYEDHYEKEIIPEEQFREFSQKYQNQKEELISELEMINNELDNQSMRDNNIDFLQEGMKALKESWEGMTTEMRNMFLKDIIKNVHFSHDKVEVDLFYTTEELKIKREYRGVLYF